MALAIHRPKDAWRKLATTLVVLATFAFSAACGDDKPLNTAGGAATETNAAPAPCNDDDECPPGIACVAFDAGVDGGFCDVGEMIVEPSQGAPVSSAAPAPCEQDSDCPPQVDCVMVDEQESGGFCDVVEMQAP
jgi:hypothetical protein